MNACSCLCSGSERCTLPIYCGSIIFLEHLQQCVVLGHPCQTVSVMSPHLTDIFLLKDLSSRWGGRSPEHKSCGDLFLHADWDRLKGTYLMFDKKKKKNEVPGATPAGRWCHCCYSSRSVGRQSDNTDWESNNTGRFWTGEPLQTSPVLWDNHLNAVVIVVLLLLLLLLFCVCLGGISSGKLVEFTFWQGNHFFFLGSQGMI